jgi:hypothetical protein
MKLVMVHGRSQEHKDPVALEKEWLDALTYGLARANRSLPPGTVVEFPFYGDALDRMVQEASAPLSADVTAKGTDSDVDPDLRGEILMEIARSVGLTDADVAREFAGQPQEKGPQNWEWVQAIVRALDRVPGLNSKAIDTVTRDVYVYLTFPGVQRKIDAMVEAAIGQEPCVLLAHSLGTVVAYNTLCQRAASPKVARLVTVGSPLGIRAIKSSLAPPLRSPVCVDHWFNAYDDRDIVALVALDARHFDVAPPIENKSDVNNFTDNRHGIAGYLADPVIASRIVEYL